MKVIRFLAVLAGLAGLATLGQACSSTPRCNLSNCNGCCDGQNQCQKGDTAAACGARGGSCAVCQGTQVCTAAAVCSGGAGGGSGGGTGGGSGGSGGGLGGGSGGSGGGGAGGGTGGAGGGGAAACNSSTCASGCCGPSGCVPLNQQDNQTCGQQGLQCVGCTSGNTCQSGACTGQSCSAATCAGGCCNGNQCIAYAQQTNGSCGGNGTTCAACSSAQTCASGACVANATVGSPCTSNPQCASLGTGAYCKLATSTGSGPYPGGTCTKPCTSFFNCPLGATCLGVAGSVLPYYGEYDKFCAPECLTAGSQSTCRAGQSCYDLSTDEGTACWLAAVPPFDGGGFPDKLGAACTADTQCINPPGPDWGFCQKATLTDGGNSGFTGGYCLAECTYDNTGRFCGSNGECFSFAGGQYDLCLRTCNNPGGGYNTQLRGSSQYVCRRYTQGDGGTSQGYLWPSCTNPGITCGAGTYCNSANGYCCDGGTCLN